MGKITGPAPGYENQDAVHEVTGKPKVQPQDKRWTVRVEDVLVRKQELQVIRELQSGNAVMD